MNRSDDAYRNTGILPDDAAEPPGIVCCSFSTGQVIGQYLGTIAVSAFGLGMGALVAMNGSTANLIAGGIVAAGFLALVYLITRNDYCPIELDGTILRARHLYTRRVVERTIDDIQEIQTCLFQGQSPAIAVMEALTGPIRAYEIRFHDGFRLRIPRSDPAMANGQALVEGVIYRMAQAGEIVAVMGEYNEKPIVRRIGWKALEA
jgi:hypothetical protein